MSFLATNFPFMNPNGTDSSTWILWDPSAGPLTLSFPSAAAVNSVWVPQLTGSISCYTGTGIPPAPAKPFFISQPLGASNVPMNSGNVAITLSAANGTPPMYVYYSTAAYNPSFFGPLANQITGVTGTLPITVSAGQVPNVSIQTPIPVAFGGTGVINPSLIAGASITINGTWPNQTIGFVGTFVNSVGATAPLLSTGGANPVISIGSPIPINLGGTGANSIAASPFVVLSPASAQTGTINVTGSIAAGSLALGVPLPVSSGGSGTITPSIVAGSNVQISGVWPNQTISVNVAAVRQTLAVANPTNNLSLALPAGSGTYLIIAKIFGTSGTSATMNGLASGSSTDAAGTGFNGKTYSFGNGNGGGPIYTMATGTGKGGDTITFVGSGSYSNVLSEIVAYPQ